MHSYRIRFDSPTPLGGDGGQKAEVGLKSIKTDEATLKELKCDVFKSDRGGDDVPRTRADCGISNRPFEREEIVHENT